MSKKLLRVLGALLALTLVSTACGGDDEGGGSSNTVPTEDIDYEAIGLWDDGACDESKETLKLGLMTVFESPVISLEDQALALEAAAEGFNARGGANGSCIEVFTCDDGANPDKAVGCVREIDEAGVVATVNDQGSTAQAEVSEAMATAGIPRVASNVTPDDWADPNAFPLDAAGTGVVFMMPKSLINEGIDKIASIRVDLPEASAMGPIMDQVYGDEAEFTADIPVPAGTTDFSQFILKAEESGAGGATLSVGEQEAIQVVRAGQQQATDLILGSPMGSFSHSVAAELGDFAENMIFVSPFAPATADLPVYDAMRSDLAASGEESLQPENLKTSPIRSWTGLYALLWMLRQEGTTDFTREGITSMLQAAKDVPMLDIYGGENWTPNLEHPGVFTRAGIGTWSTFTFDPDAEGDYEGNFVEASTIDWDETLCGSPLGAPEPC
jgi:ABC-type branched-subunit amino acid transport system substrate-binding protein